MTTQIQARRFVFALAALAFALAFGARDARAQLSEVELVADQGARNQMVTTPLGETVIAWVEDVEDPTEPFGYRTDLWVAVRPPGGPLGEPRRIALDVGECTIQLEVDELGNVALAFDKSFTPGITTALKPAGEPFQPTQLARLSGGAAFRMDIADGDIALSIVQSHFEDGDRTDWYRAMISKDGAAFSEPVMLHATEGDGDTGGHDIDLAPDGELTMAWARAKDADAEPAIHRVQAVSRSATGVVGDVQTLATSTTKKSCPQLDGDALGRVALLWLETGCSQDSLHLALKLPGAPFADPVTIAAAPSGSLSRPQLDVTLDGTINVGYSENGALQVVSGTFELPLGVEPGPTGDFADIGSRDQAASVVAWIDGPLTIVGDVAADGAVTPGGIVPTWASAVEPLGNNGAAALYIDSNGLWLLTGQLSPLPPPPLPVDDYWPPHRPNFKVRNDGLKAHALKGFVKRWGSCNYPCTLKGKGKLMLRDGGRKRSVRLSTETGPLHAANAKLKLELPGKARRLAIKYLSRGGTVVAKTKVKGRALWGERAAATASVRLRLPR